MQISFKAFGTFNQIITENNHDHALLNDCQKICMQLDAKLSAFQVNSMVSTISKNSGIQPVRIDEETFSILNRAQYFSELSAGAFDITIRPATALWGIGKNGDFIPEKLDIQDIRKLIDYRNLVVLDKDRFTAMLQKPGQQIDLGGIAKGYAADKVKEFLVQRGCSSALINFGGNIAAIGSKVNGEPWKIGIQNPLAARRVSIGTVALRNQTLVTSGVNERFFIRDGKRYHHILDPRTCYPADSSLLSVTVIGDSSMDMDALSTALFVLGADGGSQLAHKLGVDALFILTNQHIFATDGFAKNFKLKGIS